MKKYYSNKSDMHLHTIASDGNLTPDQIINYANELGLKYISITDHDSIKSYKNSNKNYFEIAKRYGISLISGVEIDSEFNGVEVHILGYDIDINNIELNEYLKDVSEQRKKRINEQIDKINLKLGNIIKSKNIINDDVDTLMKPHLILELKKTDYFKNFKYKEINSWLKENINTHYKVFKPDTKDIVRLIKESGGKVFLAHPGYYLYYKSLDPKKLIDEIIDEGLDGLELIYPYSGPGTDIDSNNEKEIIKTLNDLVNKYNLFISRGSDAHDKERLFSFNKIL